MINILCLYLSEVGGFIDALKLRVVIYIVFFNSQKYNFFFLSLLFKELRGLVQFSIYYVCDVEYDKKKFIFVFI